LDDGWDFADVDYRDSINARLYRARYRYFSLSAKQRAGVIAKLSANFVAAWKKKAPRAITSVLLMPADHFIRSFYSRIA